MSAEEESLRQRQFFDESKTAQATVSVVDGTWQEANPAFCELFGYTREDLNHLSFAAVVHPDQVEAEVEQLST
ncbi:MAG: PAS domain S-box protein [Actinomycetota bacterium]|nr:PAS domain S-box protein [Actinomycetota bacterium]MDQ6945837.1 PAS domain S-box protein [Actinomycetota bacterium]